MISSSGKYIKKRPRRFRLETLQEDLDEWMRYYNNDRTHQGKMCCGRTPFETLEDGKGLWEEKLVA